MQAVVNIPPSPGTVAPDGHDAAMLARYEAGQAAALAGTQVVPAVVVPPVAEVVPPVVAPVVPAEGAAPEVPAVVPPAGVDGILVKAGLTREALAAEYAAGGITDESFAKLAEVGISKEDFNQYLAGRQAGVAAFESTVLKDSGVGSHEAFAKVSAWAADSLTPADKAAFNAAMNSGDPAAATFALAGLQARFTAANPAEPGLIHKDVIPSGGTSAYESWAQVSADMKKPEYKTDPAFRDLVRDRLAASPAALKR